MRVMFVYSRCCTVLFLMLHLQFSCCPCSLPKFLSGVVGVDSDIKRFYCSSSTEQRKAVSILTLAEKAGMSTGIVTTTRVTHATPACSYAHAADRNWESDADIKERAKDDGSKCKDIGIV